MKLVRWVRAWWGHWWQGRPEGEAHRRGRLGEQAARAYLEREGLRFLTANYRSPRGEIDLVFREGQCLVFVEVKARSDELRGRPARAVDGPKRRRLSRAALDYVRSLRDPRVSIRFDVVEVLLAEGGVREVRHLPNTFALSTPYRHG